MKPAPIYVEIRIRSGVEEIWRLTQTPEEHRRWDLRFSEIEYLPEAAANAPQQFLYATRIGFGLRIAGAGESRGDNHGASGRVSALKFWSGDSKSLIREGSGYWKYVPTVDGHRFLRGVELSTILDRTSIWPSISILPSMTMADFVCDREINGSTRDGSDSDSQWFFLELPKFASGLTTTAESSILKSMWSIQNGDHCSVTVVHSMSIGRRVGQAAFLHT
jgi:hypothetical protein